MAYTLWHRLFGGLTMTTTTQLLATIMALPEPERFALVDALQEACEPPCPELKGEAWLAEIRRRVAEAEAGRTEFIPWEVVRQKSRAALGLPAGE